MYGELYTLQIKSFHSSKIYKCYSRIDYFFSPKILLQSMVNSSIGNIVISDHAAVFIQFSLKNPHTKTRYWRFNHLILKDHTFISYFTEEFKSFMSINLPSTADPSLLWETSKAFSRGLIISYISSKRHKQAEQRQILESKLKLAEKDFVKKPSPKNFSTPLRTRLYLNKTCTGQN